MGKIGAFGDCTGTLVDKQWVLTARHCFELGEPGSQVRFGQGDSTQTYDVTGWSFPAAGDLALARLAQPVENITPIPLSNDLPAVGDTGQSYGWSLNGKLARHSNILPSTSVRVEQIAEGGITGGSTSVHVNTDSKAGFQGGDSGGPLFINGQLAEVLTATLSTKNMYRPSPGALYSPLLEEREWIDQTMAAGDNAELISDSKEQAVDPNMPSMDEIPTQQAAIYTKPLLLISIPLLLALAVISRERRRATQAAAAKSTLK